MKRFLFAIALVCGWAAIAKAQVPVSSITIPRITFLCVSGAPACTAGTPLANGRVYTYAAGTTNLQTTYLDNGNTPNANPIVLDASGSAIIYLSNASYKITVCAPGTGGAGNCSSFGPLQYTQDNITSWLGITSTANTWTATNTYSVPIVISPTTNQIVVGTGGNQTTENFPQPPGNVTLTYPITSDTMVGRATTDTLTNKTLTSPTINTPIFPGTGIVANLNPDRQSVTVANEGVTGTTLNKLAKLTGAPSTAIITAITDTGGVIGVVTAGAGTSSSATIQTNGQASCIFDGATVAGDYVQNSNTVVGDCRDIGNSYPSSGQAVGRVLSTNAAGGTFTLEIFPPETRAPSTTTSFPTVVYNTASASTNTNIAATNMVASVATTATFRAEFTFDITVIGTNCTGSTSLNINVLFTDPNNQSSQPNYTQNLAITLMNNGPLGNESVGGLFTFRAKSGTAIQYSTTGYTAGAGCTINPSYQVFPILEQLTAN